ncbi:MAG: tetratricopeptide repeat protein [Candidatus Hydrogenedentes bacterium]|nr:tetratricopeptide repeat protein [Candidatus Hydrogenedentota bacterium]
MNADYYYDQGLTFAVKGEMDEAVKSFREAIRLEPSMAPAYHQLGKVFLKMGRFKEAVETLREAINRRPQQTSVQVDLGFAYLGAGEIELAQDAFISALAISENNVRALNGLSAIFFRQEQWDRLRAHADAALALSPDNFAALFYRGCAAYRLGDFATGETVFDRAEAVLDELLNIQPSSVAVHYLLGEIKRYRGSYGTAQEHFLEAKRLCSLDQTYTAYGISFSGLDVLVQLGMCYMNLSKPERAAEIAEEIRAVDPDHPAIETLTKTE